MDSLHVDVHFNARFTQESKSHTSSSPVTRGGSSSSSAPSRPIPIVLHARRDDSDEYTGSKKLKLSDPEICRKNAPLSADVNLLSDDMRVECLLELGGLNGKELDTNKSIDFVLSRIAGEVSGDQFLEKPSSLRLVEVGAEFERHSRCGDLQPTQDSGHVKSHGLDTWVDLRHVTQLLWTWMFGRTLNVCASTCKPNDQRS